MSIHVLPVFYVFLAISSVYRSLLFELNFSRQWFGSILIMMTLILTTFCTRSCARSRHLQQLQLIEQICRTDEGQRNDAMMVVQVYITCNMMNTPQVQSNQRPSSQRLHSTIPPSCAPWRTKTSARASGAAESPPHHLP